ncbi:MAG: AraC family transcriptional regulator [Firmicutes bacterium]|nr:AraC family transcriptional regulator [Bacillota bacterium]
MLASEIRPHYNGRSPVAISIYKCARQIPHYHRNTIETILCLKGSATVYNMHEEHFLKPGDIIQTDMFDIHSVSSEEDNLMVSFHFDLTHPLFVGQGYDLLYYICTSDDTNPKRMYLINRLRILLLVLLSFYLKNPDDHRTHDISKRILEIVRKHFQYYNHINIDEDMYPPEMMDRFERIMAYLLEHYAEKITMRDICDKEHISYNYLSQFFKDSSLKTFRNFLHEIRVYHSEHLLLCQPELSVPDIGYRVGFSDPKFFYREFKRKHEHTPHQHRIWYRNYNKKTAPDVELSVKDHMDLIKECITELYADTIYLTEMNMEP